MKGGRCAEEEDETGSSTLSAFPVCCNRPEAWQAPNEADQIIFFSGVPTCLSLLSSLLFR